MGLLITTYANLVNVWKTSREAGDQWVKTHFVVFTLQGVVIQVVVISTLLYGIEAWNTVSQVEKHLTAFHTYAFVEFLVCPGETTSQMPRFSKELVRLP